MAIARQRIKLPPACWREAVGTLVAGTLLEGQEIGRFERDFARFIGVPHAIAVPSGRAGVRFIFSALDLEPGDEVICSAFGYPVVPFLVQSMGFRLRFVDCEMGTLGMDPSALAEAISDRTRAVIATHLYGVPCRIDEIAEITAAHDVHLIEDCAHCYGASVDGRKVGSFGAAGYFSFETSKMINTMGGGMITLGGDRLAERVRQVGSEQPDKKLPWLAKRLLKTSFEATVTHPLVFNLGVYQALRFAPRGAGGEDRFASGYHGDEISMAGRLGRYTNYQARLGLRQMERLEPMARRRNANAELLIDRLHQRVAFQLPAGPEVAPNYMLVTALFPNMLQVSRALLRRGIDTKHHYMRDCSKMLADGESAPNSERAEREVLHLPAYPELSRSQVERVAERILQALSRLDRD